MPSGIFRLDINTNFSSLQESTGTRTLAMTGPDHVFRNATTFLRNVRQLEPNNLISVVSGPGTNANVIFMLDASAGAVGLAASKAAAKVGGAARRAAAGKSTKKAARKSAKKAKKSTKSKTAKKRSTRKAGKKRSTKKSAKKGSRK